MKLEEYEIICPKCNGSGLDQTRDQTGINKYHCQKCNGTGRLDWIENIIGKRKRSKLIRPGVYTTEVDLSTYIPSFDRSKIKEAIKHFLHSFIFELADDVTLNHIKSGLEEFKKAGHIKDFRILPAEGKNKILSVKHNDDEVFRCTI